MAQNSNDQPPRVLWEAPYTNRGLFADHFLKTRAAHDPEWDSPAGLDEALRELRRLYQRAAPGLTPQTNEAQTEDEFVRPVLNLLWADQAPGDCYKVQVTLPNVDGRRQPDFAFFRAAAGLEAAVPALGSIDFWRDVPCLGDAKKWSASLDRERGADENPSAQIANYLYRSRVRWGILTNGRIWRLYERERSSAGGVYYQVNLEDLLQHASPERFKWFYLFFRRHAFLPDCNGKTFLDRVLEGSQEYAAGITNRLKDSVYDALRLLMTGFFEFEANHLDRSDSRTLRQVHDESLIVLYRLLFILYAEDRGLLPTENEHYRAYCLRDLHREINKQLRERPPYLPRMTGIWHRLLNLFSLVDQGAPEAGIPEYNGGLFRPSRNPRIAYEPQPGERRWNIGDARLARVVDALAYEHERWDIPGSRDIDYQSLQVQHLGSIYEGLLELQPHVAAAPMVETLEDGKPVFKPASEVPEPRPVRGQPPRAIAAGEVYLVTNRGERKATGSYYTPKHIVDYIVENTVGPLADEAARQVAALKPKVDAEVKELEKSRSAWEAARAQGDPTAERQIANCAAAMDARKRRLLDPYLSLKILDPAMGSGHFLVGAADFLSLAMATDPGLPDLAALDGEEPQAYYKRLVVEHCLYGVDLNPLAVELAKLSLWLHTVSRDRALSFLDHHLRCGNSLIGARIREDLAREPPRLNARGRRVNADAGQLIFGFNEALTTKHLRAFLDTLRRIDEAPSGDAAAERQKERWYGEMDAIRERFRAVANCWLAPYFGVPVSAEQYERAVNALRGTDADWEALRGEEWFQQANRTGHERRFFHWELEFPEVLLEPGGWKAGAERGFDAVIANPPYIRVRKLKEDVPEEARYHEECGVYSTAIHVWDVYMLVAERAQELARAGARCGFIVPVQTLHQPNAESLRRWLLTQCMLLRVADLSRIAVFEEAIVKTCILVYGIRSRSAVAADGPVSIQVMADQGLAMSRERIVPQAALREREGFSLKPDELVEGDTVVPAIHQVSTLLSDYCYVTFGLRSCAKGKGKGDKSRLITTDPTEKSAVPYLEGREIGRYAMHWQERYIKYLPHEMYSPRSPALFETPKLISQSMLSAKRLVATFDPDGRYVEQSLVCTVPHGATTPPSPLAPVSLLYILSLMNSALISYYFGHHVIGDSLGGGLIHATPGSVSRLPIRRIEFTTPAAERAALVEQAKRRYEGALATGNADGLLAFVKEQLAAEPERADVAHDLLAFLAERMIAMNKEKQEETRGFRRWLERQIGASVEDLSNKTKLREYHEHDFETLLGVLRANRRRLSADPDQRAAQDAIEREHDASLARLRPLKERIARTDAWIDRIVYELYGLTEEEIAIVERVPSASPANREAAV
ncbi:MAG: N-6 DNA methylase [Armatimonadetes bacterium]|nr:N-6 DNA methylase [Armatimonadota bacterium]